MTCSPICRWVVRSDACLRPQGQGLAAVERREDELCRVDPGCGDDLVVTITDPLAFTHWHMGRVEWTAALRSGGIQVSGPRAPEPGPADLERRAGDERPQGTRNSSGHPWACRRPHL